MKEYEVRIEEILSKKVVVEAENEIEAVQKVNDEWYEGVYILDSECFETVSFNAEEKLHEKMKVVLLEPGKLAREAEIGTTLKDLQKIVGGNIEPGYFFNEPVCLIVNEEGKIQGLPLNRGVYDENKNLIEVIAGTAFICDCSGENFGSLSDEQLKKYTKEFKYPERFYKVNDEIKGVKFDPKSKNYER